MYASGPTAARSSLKPVRSCQWRQSRTFHDPGKGLLDVALAVALGEDCLTDIAMLRAEPAVFGPLSSDPTLPASSTPSPPRETTHWTPSAGHDLDPHVGEDRVEQFGELPVPVPDQEPCPAQT